MALSLLRVAVSDTLLEYMNSLRRQNCLLTPGSTYFVLSCSLAAATTWSGSNPNFVCNSLSGAEAPNVFMPTT